MEKFVLHKANSRGFADHGWLRTYHTFSFANYYDPDRMNFGALRVLNDDFIEQGMGFGMHPHDNMEIITIPLEGDLEHKDSMGNSTVIKSGEIQVMSAGKGIYHSEYNKNNDKDVKLLQIWVYPNKNNVKPRYDQISIGEVDRNSLKQILSPNTDDEGVWIYQNAWFHLGKLDKGSTLEYKLKQAENGVYAFIIKGGAHLQNIELSERDGIGFWKTNLIEIVANSDLDILLMELPMDT